LAWLSVNKYLFCYLMIVTGSNVPMISNSPPYPAAQSSVMFSGIVNLDNNFSFEVSYRLCTRVFQCINCEFGQIMEDALQQKLVKLATRREALRKKEQPTEAKA